MIPDARRSSTPRSMTARASAGIRVLAASRSRSSCSFKVIVSSRAPRPAEPQPRAGLQYARQRTAPPVARAGGAATSTSERALRDHAIEEPLRRALAPLRDEPVFRGDQVRAVLHVEPVRVGPVLVHAAPRIRPIVVDLAAEEMPADAPHVLVLAELPNVLVAGEDVIDVGHLEREVVQAGALVPDAEEHVVIDIGGSPVEPVERADDVVLAAGVDVVRADEA